MQSVLRTWLLILSGSAALAGAARALADDPVNRLTQAEQRSGWRMLFDGTSTQGWRNYKRAGLNPGWKVEAGALVRTGNGAGRLAIGQDVVGNAFCLSRQPVSGKNVWLVARHLRLRLLKELLSLSQPTQMLVLRSLA